MTTDATVQPLRRVLGPGGVALLTLSVLSPAASVFISGADILRQVGGAAGLAFVLGGVLTLIFTFAQAELGSAFPTAGGDYAMIGRTLGPRAGFVQFGLNLLGVPVFVALVAEGITLYLRALVPGLPPTPTALAMLTLTTGLAVLNVRISAFLTGCFLAIELAALGLLTVLGLAHPVHSIAAALTPSLAGNGIGFGALAVAVAAGSWATSGSGQAIYFSEELHDPVRVGRLVIRITLVAVATMVLPVVVVVLATPDIGALGTGSSPFIAFVAARGSPLLATLVSAGIAVAIFNASLAGLVCYGRWLYSSGRDAIWAAPINRALVRVHSRFGSPWVATLAIGVMGMAGCFVSLRLLLILASAVGIVNWLLINAAGLAGRRRGLTGLPGQYRAPLFPLTHYLSFAAAAGLAVLGWQDVETGRPGEIVVVGVVAAALLYHRFVLSRRPYGWRMAVLPA